MTCNKFEGVKEGDEIEVILRGVVGQAAGGIVTVKSAKQAALNCFSIAQENVTCVTVLSPPIRPTDRVTLKESLVTVYGTVIAVHGDMCWVLQDNCKSPCTYYGHQLEVVK
jgi:uncharacterized Zn-binding protein involved in type VI secretion